jgi:hypothetical protein
MSHVDEGQLHAYLDGQLEYADRSARERLETHVAECGDCAALLEEARAIHARAAGVMGDSEPAPVSVPSFDDVLHRASQQQTRPASLRSLRRTRSLAWAASIVVAVAVGWYAKVSTTSSTRGPGEEFEANEPSAALAENQPAQREAVEEEPPASPQLSTAADRDALASASTRGRAGQSAGERTEADEAAVDRRLGQGRGAAPAPLALQQARNDSVAAAAVEQRAADSARMLVAADRVSGVAGQRTVDSAQRVVIAQQRTRNVREPEVQGGVFAEVAALADAAEWIEMSGEDAERRLERQWFFVEGLDVLQVAVSSALPDAVVRVVQRLPSGDSLEIVQRPNAALDQLAEVVTAERRDEPLERKAVRSAVGVSSLVTTRGNLLIEMRGKVSSDSLGVLLSRLREAARSN